MDFEYDHAVYWPALNELCRQRREERLKRWTAGGKEVGESEDFLAGGTNVSVKGVEYGAGKTGVDEVEEKLAATKLEEQPVAA